MQVENSMRRMRILEQEVENDCFSNDTESVDYLTLKNEILEQSFYFLSEGVVNGSCLNEKENALVMKISSIMNCIYVHMCIYIQCTVLCLSRSSKII